MSHVLYASKDHGKQLGKHQLGQLVNCRDDFHGWGKREIPERGYGSLEVDARKWQIMPYFAPLLNRPRLEWMVYGNHLRVSATLPLWSPLRPDEQEWLWTLFPNTLQKAWDYGLVVDLFTEAQVRAFTPYFDREFIDKLQKKEGPRYVLNPAAVQKIAWEGGHGTCSLETFKRHMLDRSIEAVELAA